MLAGSDINLDIPSSSTIPPYLQRAETVAKDPVAVAEWFHIIIKAILEGLFGHQSKVKGYNFHKGVFGKLAAYYGTVENQARGALHFHLLLWLLGVTPDSVQTALQDEETKKNVVDFLSSIIREHLPKAASYFSGSTPCAMQSCPDPYDPEFTNNFEGHIASVVAQTNFHKHTFTCTKYNTPTSNKICRMNYPRQEVPSTYIDEETNKIYFSRDDTCLVPFNSALSVAVRCNTDVNFIASGRSAKAAMFYITDYITKIGLSSHHLLGLYQGALEKHEKYQDQNSELVFW